MNAARILWLLLLLPIGQVPLLPPPFPEAPQGGDSFPAPMPSGQRPTGIPALDQSTTAPRALVPVGDDFHSAPGLNPLESAAPSAYSGGRPPAFTLIEPLQEPPVTNIAAKYIVPAVTEQLATPSLTVQRVGPSMLKAGQTFSYEIVVRNIGSYWTGQARLEEQLPIGTKWIAANPAPMVSGDRLAWTLENLAPGAEQRFKVEAQAIQSGEWKAEATLTASIAVVHRATVEGGAIALGLNPIIVAGPESIPVGRPVVFSIRVTNTTSSTLTAAVLRVRLSPGLQHLRGSAVEGNLGDLAPGQSKELMLEAATSQTGQLFVDAALSSNQQILAAGRGGVLAVEQSTLGLKQTGPLSPPLGSAHDYKIEVTNRSAAELHEVVVEDVLPKGMQYVRSDGGARYDPERRAVIWTVGKLAPGQSRLVVFNAQIQGPGAQYNRITARSAGGVETLLSTIVRVVEQGHKSE